MEFEYKEGKIIWGDWRIGSPVVIYDKEIGPLKLLDKELDTTQIVCKTYSKAFGECLQILEFKITEESIDGEHMAKFINYMFNVSANSGKVNRMLQMDAKELTDELDRIAF